MESSAVLRSFQCSVDTISHTRSFLEKPGMVPVYNARQPNSNTSCIPSLTTSGRLIYSPRKLNGLLVSCVKTSEAKDTAKLNDCVPQGSLEKTPRSATFPNGFEALMLEVCDETEIAELKLKDRNVFTTLDFINAAHSAYSTNTSTVAMQAYLRKNKVGDFEMHLKRNIGATVAPLSHISPTSPPPIPTKPMVDSAPAAPAPPSPPKTSPQNTSPFANVSTVKSSKLAALEASGSNAYVLVSSPTVGSFRRGRTVKGKKQPPICKEGDVIKEGQVIGYVDQFGNELPVKSDVGGEVLKVLFTEGEAVGYGDPLIAVLPSFHGIK